METKVKFLETYTVEQFCQKESVVKGGLEIKIYPTLTNDAGEKIPNTTGKMFFTYNGKKGSITNKRTIDGVEHDVNKSTFRQLITKPMISLVEKWNDRTASWSRGYMLHQEQGNQAETYAKLF